ncbi:WD40-repeat-containing domain protein [Gigaspora rosea]|uniref:WD40-repeat-containing domain protein n=1 Tax=Gigaspora rosea TaxID=44941 RepID=A0A397W8D2_9GLOM|nr:WD40-repeat-containing domain protein [Gigaspora rosea]
MITRSSVPKKSNTELESLTPYSTSDSFPDDESIEPPKKRTRRKKDSTLTEESITTIDTFFTSTEKGTKSKKEKDEEQFFKNFRLRRIVKENHGNVINQLAFFFNLTNHEAPVGLEYKKVFNKLGHVERNIHDSSNILASVGSIQANIYDNEHCGDHLDIVSNFAVSENVDLASGELLTCCWLHRDEDALLAIAGNSRTIYIISLALSLTMKTLWGHTDVITDIQKHPKDDQHILSTARDATVRLWHVNRGTCLYVFETRASVIYWHPSGQTFLTGNYIGEIRIWETPSLINPSEDTLHLFEDDLKTRFKKIHSVQIDCIRFVNGNVLSKSINGKIEYWNYETLELIKSFVIKNSSNNRSRFDVSLDEKYFCVGTSNGTIHIYNVLSGKLVTELRHRRSTKAVRCCVFSRDTKQVLAAGEEGYIWRYDYISDEKLAEWAKWKQTKQDE